MNSRIRILTAMTWIILLLVAILATVASLSLLTDSVAKGQTETESPVPGGGGDPDGPAAPVVTGTPYSNPNGIRFDWEPVTGAEMYEVLWRTGASGIWAHIEQNPLASTVYDFYQSTSGTTFYLLVRSIAADGKVSALSNLAQATMPGTPIQTPTPTPTPTPTVTAKLPAPTLSATSTGATSVELSWTEVAGADKYDLRVWWNSDPGWQPIAEDRISGRSYTDDEVKTGRQDYFYIVAAVDSNGVIGEWSVRVRVLAPGKLPAPTLSATSTGATSVELS